MGVRLCPGFKVYPREKAHEAVQSISKIKQLSAVCRDWVSFKVKMSPNLDKLPVFTEQMFSLALSDKLHDLGKVTEVLRVSNSSPIH